MPRFFQGGNSAALKCSNHLSMMASVTKNNKKAVNCKFNGCSGEDWAKMFRNSTNKFWMNESLEIVTVQRQAWSNICSNYRNTVSVKHCISKFHHHQYVYSFLYHVDFKTTIFDTMSQKQQISWVYSKTDEKYDITAMHLINFRYASNRVPICSTNQEYEWKKEPYWQMNREWVMHLLI
jgi:hypothetical protein